MIKRTLFLKKYTIKYLGVLKKKKKASTQRFRFNWSGVGLRLPYSSQGDLGVQPDLRLVPPTCSPPPRHPSKMGRERRHRMLLY